jgi:hypothetical protein
MIEVELKAALGGLGNILDATPERGQRGQVSLPAIRGGPLMRRRLTETDEKIAKFAAYSAAADLR